jgi:preprotein translocase subunit Sss1
MIPANVAPPKTIVVDYAGAEKRLREQYVYQAFLSPAEMEQKRIITGNRLMVKFQDEIVGEAQAILVEKTNLQKLTEYDAMSSGYETTDAMKTHLLRTVLRSARKPEQAEFWKILYRWL